jgi:diaminohydroxyphosphoribosylaminopyrimidine deaminase/5-amino-6-(5-phosphoribosylamino)uracil reductase
MQDPNPLVAGKGIKKLMRAGIDVTTGVLAPEARSLNRFFLKHIIAHRPYIHLKAAQTIDGNIGGFVRSQRWINSTGSRRLVHQWRAKYDAVMVGAGTVGIDNPRLDVRLVQGRNPDVIVLDGGFSSSSTAEVFTMTYSRRVFLCVSKAAAEQNREKAGHLIRRGVTLLKFQSRKGTLPLNEILDRLYKCNIASILVEGGSAVFTEFLAQGLVDELSLFVAPKSYGEGLPAFRHASLLNGQIRSAIKITSQRIGCDVLIQALFR